MSLRLGTLFLLLSFAAHGAGIRPEKIVAAARAQIGVTVSYDSAYRKLEYPGGDIPLSTGVCSDVVIRALRHQGMDLQELVHEDMLRAFGAYPKKWGLKKPDPNIDHRRVPNLMEFFRRRDWARPITRDPKNYLPGDIVAWDLGAGVTHIGIVSNKRSAHGTPLILHNIGRGTQEEEVLFEYRILGHYRVR